jgi:hypothetical protein
VTSRKLWRKKIRVIEESKLYDPLKSVEMCLLLNVVVPKEF